MCWLNNRYISKTHHVICQKLASLNSKGFFQASSDATGDLTILLTAIQFGCKYVASKVKQAGLINL
jgi:fructose-1,6-bisphosphatase